MAKNSKIIEDSRIVDLYRKMYLARRFEEKVSGAYTAGLIAGFCHLYIGQEAVIAGVYEAIDSAKDQVITSYRDHAHILFAGTEPKFVMAELYGKATGVSKGKGGSMHVFDTARGFYGGHGIVGAQVPIGAGIAFANKYQNNGALSVTFFGDGAANQGQVYETFNMAKLWNLPAIFIVENNRYAMGTSVARGSSTEHFFKRGEGFGIESVLSDGMDIFETTKTMKNAVEYVRSGKGPVFIEFDTYRYRGHSMSDPSKYRTRSEIDAMRENRDPLTLLLRYISENKLAKSGMIEKIEADINILLDDAEEFSKNSPEPDLSELYTDIYVS